MNLKKKKQLAARTLGVGAGRIKFADGRIDEIKEAITKQDIKDLVAGGAILIKDKKGRRRKEKSGKRGPGKIKKKIKRRKREYMLLTRKLRTYLNEIKSQNKVNKEEFKKIRKQIKAKIFRSKAHFKEAIQVK